VARDHLAGQAHGGEVDSGIPAQQQGKIGGDLRNLDGIQAGKRSKQGNNAAGVELLTADGRR